MRLKTIRLVTPAPLFAIYSVLALYTNNLGEVLPASIFRPMVVVFLLSLLLLGFFWLIFKEWPKAGLMATWSLFLFLTYGHVYELAGGVRWASMLSHHRVLLPIWTVLFLGVFILVIKWLAKAENITIILNVIMGALILFSLITLVRHQAAKRIAKRSYNTLEAPQTSGFTIPQDPPDIYYILLDGYTRADVLSAKFGFDNSEFLESLEELGFTIADCSRSNYRHTHLSLPSLMNMAYIDTLVGEIPDGATIDSLRFDEFTINNRVMQSLGDIGYETVAFETSYYWAQFSEADTYFEPVQENFFTPSLSEFEEIYLDTTMISALIDWDVIKTSQFFQTPVMPNETHALRIQFTLDKLKELPEMEGSQFVLAHLVVPHPPYIFNADGVIPNLREYDESWERGDLGQAGYINNIRYINQEILQVVQQIIEESATPPIIILQADHGSDFYDRTMILSAFHLPGISSQVVNSDITPVNTFRLVFKYVFDAPLELLPDRTLSGKYPPFDFQEIEETYPQCLDHDK